MLKIGFQGIEGSYSEMTLQDYLTREGLTQSASIIGYTNFPAIVEDVINKKIERAILPIENSTTGLISRTMDLLRYQSVVAIAEAYQSVEHSLWGVEGASLDSLEEVYSHPEALSQCETFFKKYPHITPRAYQDTAESASMVARQKDVSKGSLSSWRAGELYGLVPLLKEVQTEVSNTTRFYIVGHIDDVEIKGDRLALYVETRHEAGALLKLLQVFDIVNCNLERLNARPIPDYPFSYGFFIEVDVSRMTASMELLFEMMKQASLHIQVIGQFQPVTLHSKM